MTRLTWQLILILLLPPPPNTKQPENFPLQFHARLSSHSKLVQEVITRIFYKLLELGQISSIIVKNKGINLLQSEDQGKLSMKIIFSTFFLELRVNILCSRCCEVLRHKIASACEPVKCLSGAMKWRASNSIFLFQSHNCNVQRFVSSCCVNLAKDQSANWEKLINESSRNSSHEILKALANDAFFIYASVRVVNGDKLKLILEKIKTNTN